MAEHDLSFEYDAATRTFTWVRNARRIRISGVDEERAVKLIQRHRKFAADRTVRGGSAPDPFIFSR